MDKEKIRPTTREITIKCIICGNKDTMFMTNREILRDDIIKAWCKKCKKMVIWTIQMVKNVN